MGNFGMGAIGMFMLIYGLFCLTSVVWCYFSIRFLKKGAEYFEMELSNRAKKQDQLSELLAKFDQLVDVLKVK
jgi:cell division protein FtsB